MMVGERVVAARFAPLVSQAAVQVRIRRLPSAGKLYLGALASVPLFLENRTDSLQNPPPQWEQQEAAGLGRSHESSAQQQLMAQRIGVAGFIAEGLSKQSGVEHRLRG